MINLEKSEYYSIIDFSVERIDGMILVNGKTKEEALNNFEQQIKILREKCLQNIQALDKLEKELNDFKII